MDVTQTTPIYVPSVENRQTRCTLSIFLEITVNLGVQQKIVREPNIFTSGTQDSKYCHKLGANSSFPNEYITCTASKDSEIVFQAVLYTSAVCLILVTSQIALAPKDKFGYPYTDYNLAICFIPIPLIYIAHYVCFYNPLPKSYGKNSKSGKFKLSCTLFLASIRGLNVPLAIFVFLMGSSLAVMEGYGFIKLRVSGVLVLSLSYFIGAGSKIF